MRRSFFGYTHLLLVPLLAVGLVLTGCDSNGSNGIGNGNGDGDNGSTTFEYPSDTYGAETVVNLLAFDLGVRVGNASDNSEAVLDELYTGTIDDKTVPTSGISAQQSTYGDIAGGVDLSSLTDDAPLLRSQALESGDSPTPGSAVTTDQLLGFYLQQAGANDVTTTDNGIVLSQFAEKMLLGTPIYGQGAAILSDFADGTVSSNRAEQWDAAFGYFGFPRTLEPFLDYSDGDEGLADGNVARDVDGNGSVDLTSEYVYTWASYAIERAATAENNGQPNDFARNAFEALVQGREAIENGEDPSGQAQTALEAWEATVAVNVIHYINSMESNLEDVSGQLEQGDVGADAWGEAKAFTWNLQFYSDNLDDSQLNTIHDAIGNDPPYGELTADEYASDLQEATDILANAYGFDASNVANW
ncbi:MAG: hypothetical protein V5A20_12770 [Salinibacter sp.]|uniref:hypothetical protein n=1 Tax=Salinibacter sp. TaxID=2065818 RepID=UPI002FC33239